MSVAVCEEIIVVRVQPSATLLILAPCLTGLISRELNNSQVNDPSFCWGTSRGLKSPLRKPLLVLTEALGHKLRVYDVVSSLVGFHHVEAAVAPAVERP